MQYRRRAMRNTLLCLGGTSLTPVIVPPLMALSPAVGLAGLLTLGGSALYGSIALFRQIKRRDIVNPQIYDAISIEQQSLEDREARLAQQYKALEALPDKQADR
ncbi:MAG: hypothetical protein VKJ06_04600 [Vampirovibrionales bacterium]|nr:hypothetical protein [Vampirovibrionales bacterium]